MLNNLTAKCDRKRAQRFVVYAKEQREIADAWSVCVRREKYACIANVCAEGLKLASDKPTWLAFIKTPIWDDVKARPKAQHRDQAVRYLLRIYCGVKHTRRASLLWCAVRSFLEQGGDPFKVADLLYEGGGPRKVADADKLKKRGEGVETSGSKSDAPRDKSRTSLLKDAGARAITGRRSINSEVVHEQVVAPRGRSATTSYTCRLIFGDGGLSLATIPCGEKIGVVGYLDEVGKECVIRVTQLRKLK